MVFKGADYYKPLKEKRFRELALNDFHDPLYDTIISIGRGVYKTPDNAEYLQHLYDKFGLYTLYCDSGENNSLSLLLLTDKCIPPLAERLNYFFGAKNCYSLSPVFPTARFEKDEFQLSVEHEFSSLCNAIIFDCSEHFHKIAEPEKTFVTLHDLKRCLLSSMQTWVYAIAEKIAAKYGFDEDSLKLYSCKYQTIDVLIETPEVWDRVLNMKDAFEDTCFSVIHSLDGIGFIVKDDIEFKYIKAYALSPDERENAVKNYERYWGFRDRW